MRYENVPPKCVIALTVSVATAGAALAAAGWNDDYDKAVATAKAEKKLNELKGN